MRKRTEEAPLPIWGYVVLNVTMLALLIGTYFASVKYAEANFFVSSGMFPVLAICYLSFLAVSVLDALWDRSSPAQKKESIAPRPESRGSKDSVRKSDVSAPK